ncbi:FKBP-type peptidyl-prolyl cis-trans isomerase [Roseateles cellulosilyticus]|uniref:Peptidyl-prolyl cis-trans isomerase n=1 Tax=Pelomonas cellulosilytica TaxID=2906762 RepID=A0ABS8Y4L8_9BURK|nr:FKBP-type peptidyl-prolyl cis-trans isomerase [Pelomonas sp. P8]MCE4558111.1 FKBP-type peptidyl-prolyl cis-trans isomerase [Pelomonas sp. P8]
MTVVRTRRLSLLLALSASLGLAACGGGGGDGGSGTPPTSDPNGWNAVTGLKTADTVVGSGATADTGKPVTVAYTGWVYDVRNANSKGTQFGTNVGAAPFYVLLGTGNPLKGFDQGIQGMKVGGKRTVTVPAGLGYGSTGTSDGVIPANAALVFDIELLAVDPNGWLKVTQLKTVDTLVGAGAVASAGKTVSVTYTGWLYDERVGTTKGTQFDSNVGKAALTFKLGAGGTIAGFDTGIQGMQVGGKRTITIPAAQGYGSAGYNGIPGGAALVFDVEVTAVN